MTTLTLVAEMSGTMADSTVAERTTEPIAPCIPCFIQSLNALLTWPFVILVLVVGFVIYYRKEIRAKLRTVKRIGKEGVEFEAPTVEEALEKVPTKTTPPPSTSNPPLSVELVSRRFSDSGEFSQTDVETYAAQALTQLVARGIQNSEQLRELFEHPHYLNVLKAIYIAELKRGKTKPLDPMGVAVYGPALYLSDLHPVVVLAITEDVRRSPEWREKHAALFEAIRRRRKARIRRSQSEEGANE